MRLSDVSLINKLESRDRSSRTKSYEPFAAAQSIGDAYHHWSPVLSHRNGRLTDDVMKRRNRTQCGLKLSGDFGGEEQDNI